MKKRKLGIIGGSGLYKMEGFEKTKWKKINTPWGKPSDEILIASFGNTGLWLSLCLFFIARALTLFVYMPRIYQRVA